MTARTPYKHKTKQYECDAAERAKYLSDTDSVRAVGIRKASGDEKYGSLYAVSSSKTSLYADASVERMCLQQMPRLPIIVHQV